MTQLFDWLKDYDWRQLADLLLLGCVYIFKLLLTWYLVCNILIICIVLWRFCQVKFGKKIKPNGDLAILITGATSGFGLALAKLFYKLGFTVIATYYNDQEIGYKELQDLSAQPIKTDGRLNFKRPYLFLIRMDVRSSESIVDCGKQVDLLLMQHDVKLYCLINNAGIGISLPFPLFGRETIVNSIGTNLTGSMLVTRQFLLRIVQMKGKVINVSSGSHLFPGARNEVYGSTKSAVYHFSLALHSAIERYGASSVCVIPGNFVTTSNIAYGNVKILDTLKRNLTDEEQNFYQDLIVEYQEYVNSVLANKLKKSGDNLDEAAAIFDFKIPDLNRIRRHKKREGFLAKLYKLPLSIMSGGTSSLENSLKSYEQAVCLKRPPITLFPGNFFYSYFIGPMVETAPIAFNNWIGNHVIDSLLRAV